MELYTYLSSCCSCAIYTYGIPPVCVILHDDEMLVGMWPLLFINEPSSYRYTIVVSLSLLGSPNYLAVLVGLQLCVLWAGVAQGWLHLHTHIGGRKCSFSYLPQASCKVHVVAQIPATLLNLPLYHLARYTTSLLPLTLATLLVYTISTYNYI